MHQFSLLVPSIQLLPEDVHERILCTDFLGALLPCAAKWEGELLLVETSEPSCYLQLPCFLPDGDERMLTTSTLLSRGAPYVLPLELARGILNRLADRYWEWYVAGIDLSGRFGDPLTASRRAFSRAVAAQHDLQQGGDLAQQALQQACALMGNMSQWMSRFLIDRHREGTKRAKTLMMGRLPETPLNNVAATSFVMSFDMAVIPTTWKSIQPAAQTYEFETLDQQLMWCHQHGLESVIGPLVDLQGNYVPDWLASSATDSPQVVEASLRWVENVIRHCQGQPTIWHAASGLAGPQTVQMDVAWRLELAMEIINRIEQFDAKTPILMSFDQPFGESCSQADHINALDFIVMLIENQAMPDAVGLDLRFDIWPRGSVRRDPIDLLQSLDDWIDLDLPLFVLLSAPSARPMLRGNTEASRVTHRQPSTESQARIVKELAALLITHPAVQGICWNEWTDSQPYRFPGSGLLTANDEPKPALESWRSLLSYASGK